MRVVFLGTPEFAVPTLRTLLESSYVVSAVFAQPDRPAGRGQKAQSPPVKRLAQTAGIPIYQPLKIRAEENRPLLESLKPDFLVVVAYGQILPGWLLRLPAVAPVNVHASVLPRYRGAAPVQWAILNGDSTTGVTTMLMEETLDTGPILLQSPVSIPLGISAGELQDVLARKGADLVIPTLEGLRSGTLIPVPQDASRASLAPKITKEMAPIDWKQPALQIHNRIRALNPWPLASTKFRDQILQVFRSFPRESRSMEGEQMPGTLVGVTEAGILIRCGGNTLLELLEVQLPGRKPTSGRGFANGARLQLGDLLFP
jgi:methionyl-tRNA formyltransferase